MGLRVRQVLGFGTYLTILAFITAHFYQAPFWDLDMLGYMGNAHLHDTRDPVKLHQIVYDELRYSVPPQPLAFSLVLQANPTKMARNAIAS
jgi:hypothetical protein